MGQIAQNLTQIREKLQTEVKLLAVSKTKPIEDIRIAYHANQRDFGENKVQELLFKSKELQDLTDIQWHFIGKLQSNKINQLLSVESLVSIHSVDRIELVEKLLSKNPSHKIGLFLQVNTSGEKEKGGFQEDTELLDACKEVLTHEKFFLQGLMTMGRIRTDDFEADARKSFESLRQKQIFVRKQLGQELELSMGMSQDFEIAQECGSNWVRIGSDIFGKRS